MDQEATAGISMHCSQSQPWNSPALDRLSFRIVRQQPVRKGLAFPDIKLVRPILQGDLYWKRGAAVQIPFHRQEVFLVVLRRLRSFVHFVHFVEFVRFVEFVPVAQDAEIKRNGYTEKQNQAMRYMFRPRSLDHNRSWATRFYP